MPTPIHHLLSTVYVCAVLLALPAAAQSGTAADTMAADDYAVYTSAGTPASLDDVAAAMDTVSVVFVGEQHDDPAAHALELRLLERAAARSEADTTDTTEADRPVVLSLEMFERDAQPVLDEYLGGLIAERHFLAAARPWGNYADYRPLVEFARAHDVPVLAANAPRRYVNRVARLGRESLADLRPHARALLPPLPYPGPTPAYRDKWMALMREAAHGDMDMDASEDSAEVSASPHGHGGGGMERMLDAQALWDAAMAYRLAQQLMETPDALVLHVAGAFHVEGGLGTPAQLRTYRPGTPSLVVAIRPTDDVATFDPDTHAGLGDFVVLTDAALPRTSGGAMQ